MRFVRAWDFGIEPQMQMSCSVDVSISYDNAVKWLQDQTTESLQAALAQKSPVFWDDTKAAPAWVKTAVQEAIDRHEGFCLPSHISITVMVPPRLTHVFPVRITAMPLTSRGQEIKGAMQEQYGEKKGEQVFYASKNAGTIKGVDEGEANSSVMPDPGSAPMGDTTRDYDPEAMGEFKTAGPPGLTLAQVQADADALWKRQYNDGPLGSDDPAPIAWPVG